MQRTLVVALMAGVTAIAFATPASALPASPAAHIDGSNAGVIEVGRNDRNWRKGNWKYRGYAYRPHYRYSRPYPYYYRPYAYGGYPYWYGRPGISFGFSF